MTEYPNLGAVITQADVSTKGTGSYAADYVNWCRVTHLLHDNAPGWQFVLKAHEQTGHVWKAPDGTAYVVGCFEHINGSDTPPFPQAIMDNRNNAILLKRSRPAISQTRIAAASALLLLLSLALLGSSGRESQ